MKSFVVALLPLAVSSAVIAPRQENPSKSPFGPLGALLKGLNSSQVEGALTAAVPRAKVASVKTVPFQIRSGAKRVAASYGPYVLAGKDVRFDRAQWK